ncbi:MAG: translation initiation factor IF-2 [Actinomycetia bacterium]|nr:translation initiation factor IF-2 [Actinomycetes bacterium]
MASMRVHELAKELNLDSKDLLSRLEEMKIPVKSHSSTLNDAFVARIRKQLGAETAAAAAAADAKRLAEEQLQAQAERKEREAAEVHRRRAAEQERARRRKERAQNDDLGEPTAQDGATETSEGTNKATQSNVATEPGEDKGPKKPIPRFSGLLSQIEAENRRLADEKKRAAKNQAESEAKAKASKQAATGGAASAKSRVTGGGGAAAARATGQSATKAALGVPGDGAAGAQRLPQGQSTKASQAAAVLAASQSAGRPAADGAAPLSSADAAQTKVSQFGHPAGDAPITVDNVGSQALDQATVVSAAADPAASGSTGQPVGQTGPEAAQDAAKDHGSGKVGNTAGGSGGSTDQNVVDKPGKAGRKKDTAKRSQGHALDDYANYNSGTDEFDDDRYRQMALAAEKFQRERVLAEARAAVEAASSEGEGRRRKRRERREAEAKERIELEAIEKGVDPELLLGDDVIQVTSGASVSELADAMQIPANDIVKRLFMLGTMMTVTQSMSDELVELIAEDMGYKVHVVSPEEEYAVSIYDSEADLQPRPPVVTVMGHVDHGKTSLLDAIRETSVVSGEAGGITQHIGASVVDINNRQITFIDTPGHEAFTAMRARGAKVTDVVVLVVAADDGVMPQTVEAIHHAEAAGVPIVVAINKIDKPGANLDRVRNELSEQGIISEEWGGQNMFVEVSARMKVGIDDLLETILLQADVLELRANPNAAASGFVIEAKLDKGRGPVATVLVQRGCLHGGDTVVAGTSFGHVRALINPKGEMVAAAYPADPVEILGLSSVPEAGDEFRVFAEERDARNLAVDRALRKRQAEQQERGHASLEDLFARIEEGAEELNLVVKADVQGSIEALKDALAKMDQDEVRLNVIHSAVGGITETDVTLAAASDAVIIGFNVRPQPKARLAAEREKVEIKTYRVIYQAIEDINQARIGLLKPDVVEEETGAAEVLQLFRVPKQGTIAGCLVSEGEIESSNNLRVVRDGAVVFEGKIASLRHYRDEVKSVRGGSECGIGVEGFQDLKEGDILEAYRMKEVARDS